MKADRTTVLRMVFCFTVCLAALPALAAPPLPQGPEIKVNSRTEEMRDGDGTGIFGRAFAANGSPRSGDDVFARVLSATR